MKRLLTLGCSLSPKDFWPAEVGKHFDKHNHYSFGGGGNQQLLDCIDEFLITNDVKNLTIVYQITGMMRAGGLYLDMQARKDNEDISSWSHIPDTIRWDGHFGKQWMVWTDNYETVYNEIRNPITMMTRVFSKLCLLADAGANVYTFRGWTGVMSQETFNKKINLPLTSEKYWDKAKELLNKNNVTCIDQSIVNWCIENDKELPDGFHPSCDSSHEYAKEILIPLMPDK